MTQKERLVDLLDGLELPPIDTDGEMYLEKSDAEYIADYLLKNGVIVPPCKVGDAVYDIENGHIDELTVNGILSFKNEMQISIEREDFIPCYFDEYEIGDVLFFTREAAEQALKECET